VVALSTTHPAGELGAAHRVVSGWSPALLGTLATWFES
jgi:hypothetical protein